MDFWADAKSCRRKVLSGVVGGGVNQEEKGRKCGSWWCGEGRRMVCVGVDIGGKSVWDNRAESGSACTGSSTSRSEGGAGPTPPQNNFQKSNNFSTISPFISMQPSNHTSQLTLQLGKKAVFRSTRMNFGCMTLNGLTKILFTTSASPCISS
jgi:hypothetical protein